jgi:hypothetical protein
MKCFSKVKKFKKCVSKYLFKGRNENARVEKKYRSEKKKIQFCIY